MARSRVFKVYLWSSLVWCLAMTTALKLGAVENASMDILTLLRFPRALLASVIGMGLAVAGAALQALFANPLCEPYTLGISSGAALGAVLGISLGLEWNFAGLTGTAFAGALCFALVLFGLSSRSRSNNATLLLSGVMLGFFGTSIVALWISLTDSNGMQAAIGWLFGDLSRARMKGVWMTLGVVSALVLVIWGHWRELDALLMGRRSSRAGCGCTQGS
jgi:iron complex transport system permease protein